MSDSPTPAPTPQDPPADTTAPPADKTFTQADLDRIVQERLARDRKDRPSDDELKALREAKSRLDEMEAASQSELEKAQKRLADLEAKATAAEEARKEALLKAAVIAEAAKKNVVDPDAAYSLLDRGTLEFEGDGSPKNIADAMDALLEARPFLVAPGGPPRPTGPADQGPRGGSGTQLTQADLKNMSPDEIVAARKEGRLDSVLQGS